MGQRYIARNFNINNTREGHNNQDLSLTQILQHNQYIKIYHQNSRSWRNKTNELLCNLHDDPCHILCLTEHHLHHDELASLCIENYTLGAYYCRKTKKQSLCLHVY